jgi:hypothetical protein
MSQSRSIRFSQIRIVTDGDRIDPNRIDPGRIDLLRDIARLPAIRLKTKHWTTPAAPTTYIDTPTLSESNELRELKESFEENFAPRLLETKAERHDETGANGNDDWIESSHKSIRESTQSASQQPSTPSTLDDADQKVSMISTMSLVRSIVADEGLRAIADLVARICNDEANDRNGPWYFEMHRATHMLPMTILSIELSPGEILLRFVSGDAASVRLISDRKQDLKTQLENRLSPARSVQIEIISE